MRKQFNKKAIIISLIIGILALILSKSSIFIKNSDLSIMKIEPIAQGYMQIDIINTDNDIVLCNAKILITFQQLEDAEIASNYYGIVLPFSESSKIEYFMDETTSCEVLHGYLSGGGKYLFYQIKRIDQTPFTLTIEVKNIEFQSYQASGNNNRKSFTIPIKNAINEAEQIYNKELKFIQLSNLSISNIKYVQAIPSTFNKNTDDSIITHDTNADIIIYYEQSNTIKDWLIICLYIFGAITVILNLIISLNSLSHKVNLFLLTVSIILVIIESTVLFLIVIPNVLYKNESMIPILASVIISSIIALIISIYKVAKGKEENKYIFYKKHNNKILR